MKNMHQETQLIVKTLAIKQPITRLHLLWGCPLIALPLTLVCLTLSPRVQAASEGDLGNGNTAEGSGALSSLTSGHYNTAMGYQALLQNSSGGYNTATGLNALLSNTTASYNTANGADALYSNTTGSFNTATGLNALLSNTTASYNTATGFNALVFNTIGSFNTATGVQALYSNTTGSLNTATGVDALLFNTNGGYNTATGQGALYSNTSGSTNTAHGFQALLRNTTGSNNIALGYLGGSNLTTGNNNIDIGNSGVAAEANTIRIGTAGTQSATFIAGINGTALAGSSVVVDGNGQLGTAPSSRRFKAEIKLMGDASEAILALRPVSFRYNQEIDPKGNAQFGLVAEEVEKVNPDLVVHDSEGKVYSVRYEAVNAMLLNEFLKQHHKVQEQEATISLLRCIVEKQQVTISQQQKELQSTAAHREKEIQALAARLKEQQSQIQKVSGQLEVSSPRRAPQVVQNNE
jgi:Chaperone of endosialidase